MSAELAVGVAAVAFVLMVGIVAGFGAVVLLDAVTVWPPRVKHVGRHRPPMVVDSVVIRSEPVLGGAR